MSIQLPVPNNNKNITTVKVICSTSNHIFIISLYIPPIHDISQTVHDFENLIEEIIEKYQNPQIFIYADLNSKLRHTDKPGNKDK